MSFTANPKWQSARWWGCASAFKPKSCQPVWRCGFCATVLKRPCLQTDRRATGCCDHRAQTFKRQCFQTNTEPRLAAQSLGASVQTELFSDRQKALSAPPPLLWGGGGTCARLIEIPGLSLSSTLPSVFLFIRLACVTGSVAMATGAR